MRSRVSSSVGSLQVASQRNPPSLPDLVPGSLELWRAVKDRREPRPGPRLPLRFRPAVDLWLAAPGLQVYA